MLHVAVKRTQAVKDIALLLDRGADKSVRNGQGRRSVDLVPRSLKELRRVLGGVVRRCPQSRGSADPRQTGHRTGGVHSAKYAIFQ